MPLPNAPSPKDSNIYKQLSSESLGSTSKDNFDVVQNPVFLDSASEDELRRINLVGQATNLQSQSGPIPGTGKVKEVLDTTGSGTPISTLLEPSEGEAFEITAANWETKNANAAFWRIQDPTTAGTGVLVEYKTASGTLDITTTPIRIVYPQKFVVYYGTASGDNQTNLAYHQIR
jgi:hypothetical protein